MTKRRGLWPTSGRGPATGAPAFGVVPEEIDNTGTVTGTPGANGTYQNGVGTAGQNGGVGIAYNGSVLNAATGVITGGHGGAGGASPGAAATRDANRCRHPDRRGGVRRTNGFWPGPAGKSLAAQGGCGLFLIVIRFVIEFLDSRPGQRRGNGHRAMGARAEFI